MCEYLSLYASCEAFIGRLEVVSRWVVNRTLPINSNVWFVVLRTMLGNGKTKEPEIFKDYFVGIVLENGFMV